MTEVTDQQDGWETVCCPKCQSDKSRVVCKGRDYLYHVPGEYFASECEDCGFCYQNPRPTADRLVDLYPSDYSPHAAKEAPTHAASTQEENTNSPAQPGTAERSPKIRHADYLARRLGYTHLTPNRQGGAASLLSKFSDGKRAWKHGVSLTPEFVQGGHVLEIGCGNGSKLEYLGQLGWEHLSGIELVPEAAEEARSKGVAVECGMVEEVLDGYPDHHFDVVISSMVFEHLYDPFAVAKQVAAKLKPGGQFLFSTISRDSLDAKLFGPYWAGFDFPRHMVHFRVQDIRDMLSDGFNNLECFHQNAPIDYVRSASWRNSGWDRIVGGLAKSPIRKPIGAALAKMGLSTRVSFRCRRKSVEETTCQLTQRHAA